HSSNFYKLLQKIKSMNEQDSLLPLAYAFDLLKLFNEYENEILIGQTGLHDDMPRNIYGIQIRDREESLEESLQQESEEILCHDQKMWLPYDMSYDTVQIPEHRIKNEKRRVKFTK